MTEKAAGRGYIVVLVAIHRCGIPLEGAKVTLIRLPGENENDMILYTGVDGLTEMFAVETPPRGSSRYNSETSTYYIDVEKKGYSSVKNYKVSVYDGVTMRQSIFILPLIDL